MSVSEELQNADKPEFISRHTREIEADLREINIKLSNVHCAACVEKIRSNFANDDSVASCIVNPVTGYAHIAWHPSIMTLSKILTHVTELGYPPVLPTCEQETDQQVLEQRAAITRITIAGLAMVQVMMFSVGMYFGAFSGMEANMQYFLRLVSLLVATPVVFYSAAPFFANAYHDLRARHAGMDVPVSLAIGGAYFASVWSTFTRGEEVYFDSVAMFVFFLSIGRFLESKARHKVNKAGHELAALLPSEVVRIIGKQRENVAIELLRAGDIIIISSGDVFPADGILKTESTHVDEAMLTGEANPLRRDKGQTVYAGTLNLGPPVSVEISAIGDNTVLSGIQRLVQNAENTRPRIAQLAERVAGIFTLCVLLVAAGTALFWWLNDPASAFTVTLSVLVVTCPCALALAVPAAMTAATGAFVQQGMLVIKPDAIENLNKVTDFVFDKTGTLTEGAVSLRKIITCNNTPKKVALNIAAALERDSRHPLAGAFKKESDDTVDDVKVVNGRGLEGRVNGTCYRLGTSTFIAEWDTAAMEPDSGTTYSWIGLADNEKVLAWFAVGDELRVGAKAVISRLQQAGYGIHLLSGDANELVAFTAEDLGIENFRARLLPDDKLEYIRTLQENGRIVAMVGDGINDGPVLAGANLSIAMSSGSAIAQSTADLVYTRHDMNGLIDATQFARRSLRVIKQNLSWALLYNLVTVPAAVAGLVAPWMASIGMSASSLLVVTNALRLARKKP